MLLTENIQRRLLRQAEQSLTRKNHIIRLSENQKIFVDKQLCIDFSSNDYLGLKKHPKIIEAFIKTAKKYGVGSGASAMISGYTDQHAETERCFSAWLGVDRVILFSSGYCANVGIISALVDKSAVIFSDKLCHASLLDGISLSRAQHHRYQHNNMASIRDIAKSYLPDLIVTESIFSMEGDLAPVDSLIQLAQEYQSGLVIDDAHGIGILGKTGAGIIEHFNLEQAKFSCLVIPLGKAFNAAGAIVAGRADIIESILQFCRSYHYTTAIPPAICGAVQAALKIIQEEKWRRQKLMQNIQFFISYAKAQGLNLVAYDQVPVKAILINDNNKMLALQKFLLSKGFYVPAIRPPTVPRNNARLRISLSSLHTTDEIALLINHILLGLKVC